MSSLRHPPRPRVAFRVAIVGHRRDKLPPEADDAVGRAIEAVLATVARRVTGHRDTWRELYHPDPPRLTVLSALAEGADRLGAELAQGDPAWQLHAVLPFAEEEYQRDFLPPDARERDSRDRFRELLLQAEQVTVLDGVPGRFDAYEPLARAMVEMADLLIAVWDGAPAAGPGGTANLVRQARRDDLPIVRIDPTPRGTAWLEDLAAPDHGRAAALEPLAACVDRLLAPPHDIAPALRWFAERGGRGVPPRLFDRVLGLIGGHGRALVRRLRPARPAAIPADPGTSRVASWRASWPEIDRRLVDLAADHFGPHAGWADDLARWYAARFRSTFTAVYLLAVAAVLVGGLLHLDPIVPWNAVAVVLAAAEPLLLVTMLWMVRSGRRSELHERWLDYRSLAERLRHLGVLWPLARTTPLIRVPDVAVPDDPRRGWVAWLLRSIARDAGLAPGRLDGAHPAAARRLALRLEAVAQREFHACRRRTLGDLTGPVERLAEGLVLRALVLSLLQHTDLVGQLLELLGGVDTSRVRVVEQRVWVILAAVVTALPAMAAAIHGFLGTADLEGIALRSAAIEGRLAQLEAQLRRLDPVDLAGVGDLVAEMTRTMEGELGSWHAAAASRRLQAG